jgi:hypothetical protein
MTNFKTIIDRNLPKITDRNLLNNHYQKGGLYDPAE